MTWSSEVKRPNYRDGMYLGAQDFVAEQDYEMDLRRRLCLGHHAWGIFEGLQLVEQADPGTGRTNVSIVPGLAIDGFGRPLLVFASMPLDPALFQGPEFNTDKWVPVWALYNPVPTDPPRLGFELCDDPTLTTRTTETVKILVGDQPGPHDAVRIAGQPVLDSQLPPDTSVAYGGLPDDSEFAVWPVCLGQVHWDGIGGFVPSKDSDRRAGRMLGGVIAANAYAPEGAWDLSSRLRDPANPTQVGPVAATVHGTLTVQGLLTAKASLELDGGQITFDDLSGSDQSRPVFVRRADTGSSTAGSTDLLVEIGKATTGHDRLVVMSSGTARLTVRDDGASTVAGTLSVQGLLDLSQPGSLAGQDRVFFGGTLNGQSGVAIGLESSGHAFFHRAEDGFNWYLNDVAGGNAAMNLDALSLKVMSGLLVGWKGNGRIRSRHLDGKDWQSDGLDNLYLNWETGKDVVVGNVGGTPSNLYVSGHVFVGSPPNQVQLTNPIDIQAGVHSTGVMVGRAGTCVFGTDQLVLTSNLNSVSRATLMVSLANIHNTSTAVDARWSIGPAFVTNISGRTVTFDIPWEVCDDGDISAYSWVAIFYP